MPQGAARSATITRPRDVLPPNVIVAFDGTNTQASALSGYTRVASLNGFYLIGVSGNNPGDSVGSATHTHNAPHTHTAPGAHSHGWNPTNARGGLLENNGSQSMLPRPHSHPGGSAPASVTVSTTNVASSATAVDPQHYEVIWMETTTDVEIATGILVWSDTGTVPAGWAVHSSSNARFLKGAAMGGDAGATGGSASHSHTESPGHTHSIPHSHAAGTIGAHPIGNTGSSAFNPPVFAPNVAFPTFPHSHPAGTGTGTTGDATSTTVSSFDSANVEPLNLQLLIYEAGANGVATFPGMIVATLLSPANVPAGWSICDGTNGTPNLQGRIAKNTTSSGNVGVTGGSTTHAHTYPAHGHTAVHGHPGTSGVMNGPVPPFSQWNVVSNGHTQVHTHSYAPASMTIDNAANINSTTGSSIPASKAVLFIRKD